MILKCTEAVIKYQALLKQLSACDGKVASASKYQVNNIIVLLISSHLSSCDKYSVVAPPSAQSQPTYLYLSPV